MTDPHFQNEPRMIILPWAPWNFTKIVLNLIPYYSVITALDFPFVSHTQFTSLSYYFSQIQRNGSLSAAQPLSTMTTTLLILWFWWQKRTFHLRMLRSGLSIFYSRIDLMMYIDIFGSPDDVVIPSLSFTHTFCYRNFATDVDARCEENILQIYRLSVRLRASKLSARSQKWLCLKIDVALRHRMRPIFPIELFLPEIDSFDNMSLPEGDRHAWLSDIAFLLILRLCFLSFYQNSVFFDAIEMLTMISLRWSESRKFQRYVLLFTAFMFGLASNARRWFYWPAYSFTCRGITLNFQE